MTLRMTTSAASEIVFVKELALSSDQKRTRDAREFLKHRDKGDHSI